MCNFGSQACYRIDRRTVSSCIGFGMSKYQGHILNTIPLYIITGYITEYSVGGDNLNIFSCPRLNLIDGSILSYLSVLNSPEWLGMIKK